MTCRWPSSSGYPSEISESWQLLLEPGLVQAPLWWPEGRPPRPRDLEKLGIYAGVGRKTHVRL
jgi:hypothetical protein